MLDNLYCCNTLRFYSILKSTIYNEADSSMEASNGLNPHSSQGFAEIQSVEAKMLAKAKQIKC